MNVPDDRDRPVHNPRLLPNRDQRLRPEVIRRRMKKHAIRIGGMLLVKARPLASMVKVLRGE